MRFPGVFFRFIPAAVLILSCTSAPQKVNNPEPQKAVTYADEEITPDPGASSEIPARREFPVNPAFRPCDDFYQYACSKVNESFKLREDRSYHDFAFSDSSERLLEAKKKFMKELGQASGAPA